MPTSPVVYTAYVSDDLGNECAISGSGEAVDKVIAAMKMAGARWHAGTETWDFGFYPASEFTEGPEA